LAALRRFRISQFATSSRPRVSGNAGTARMTTAQQIAAKTPALNPGYTAHDGSVSHRVGTARCAFAHPASWGGKQ
jgi:hypothetical protein